MNVPPFCTSKKKIHLCSFYDFFLLCSNIPSTTRIQENCANVEYEMHCVTDWLSSVLHKEKWFGF